MNFKLNKIIQLIILLLLFNLSYSSNLFVLDEDEKTENYNEQNLILELKTNVTLKNYLQIKVEGQESETIPHIIEYCVTESSETRIQLSYNPTLVNYIWLTKNQVNEGKYIKITCPEECNYNLKLVNSESLIMEKDSEYNYYVSDNNQEMIFDFPIDSKNLNENSYITIWVIGVKEKKVELKGGVIKSQTLEDERYIYNLEISDNIKVTVKATKGDLISIGSRIINNGASTSPLLMNSPEIYGLLNSDEGQNKTCYPLNTGKFNFNDEDLVYISIKIYNDFGLVNFAYGESLVDEKIFIKTGYSNFRITAQYASILSFCVSIPSDYDNLDINKVIYGISMSYSYNQKFSSLIYTPQRLGEFYPRIIDGGNLVGYIGMPPNKESEMIEYNMITILGFPDMHFDICTTYPLCLYNTTSFNETKDPHNINSMSSYSVKYNETITAISPTQNILLVNCTEGLSKSRTIKQDESEINKKTCEFYTLIYTSLDKIKLIENQMFNQYILKDDIDRYTISFKHQKNLYKLFVDLMIFSGDVILKTDKDEKEVHKYQTANKIFYSINIAELKIDSIDFQVEAKTNSFYSIQYTLVRSNQKDSSYINYVPTGINYLVTIDPFDKSDFSFLMKKILNFDNVRVNDEHPYLVNFYSLNCQLSLKKMYNNGEKDVEEPLVTKDYYFSQDIVDTSDIRYKQERYTYEAAILTMEQGTYNKKMCMLYASSIELEREGKSVERQILVSENVIQKVIFEKGNIVMKYLYVIPNKGNDIGIRFILNDKALYSVDFYLDRNLTDKLEISSNQQETIEKAKLERHCPENQPCPLIVEIKLLKSYSYTSPGLEIAIKSLGTIEKYPSYLIKNKLNSEYLSLNSPNYYYTDIGEAISGEIIINYYRGNGKIYGRIVKKDQKTPDLNPEWRGIFEFPKTVNGTLPYTTYLKRLQFTEEDTEQCNAGCYLLLTVENKVSSYLNISSRYFSYDILIKTKSEVIASLTPITSIPLDTYIIGNISPEELEDSKTFYKFYISYDTDKVVFDFQSEYASFYVNLYINDHFLYPNKDDCHWEFKSTGNPHLFELGKNEILELAKRRELIDKNSKSIEGLSLIIGISAEETDSIFTTIYSFKVHLSVKQELNIYDVYSDQQTLCNSVENDKGKYSCLYVVRYDNYDSFYHLLIHPIFEDQSVDFSMYADFINEDFYDLNDFNKLKDSIPNEKSNFTTDKMKYDFLLIDLKVNEDSYVYVNVETDKPTLVKLLTTFSTYDYTSSPNPSTPQLYINSLDEMRFKFNPNDELMINLVSLNGTALVYWEDEKEKNVIHKLRGRDDRLSITTPHAREGDQLNTLVIKNLNPSMIFYSVSGFIFYTTFYLRSTQINFDQLSFGKSFNLNYRETDFPIYIYSKLNNTNKDVNAFMTIYSLESDDGEIDEEEELQIMAWVLKDSSIFDIKRKKDLAPKTKDGIKGIYDPAKRVCLISLKKEDMERYDIGENEIPNLVIQIDKNTDSTMARKYSRISLEGTVIQDDSLIPITEKVYQHGKLKQGTKQIMYKLRTDKKQPITSILFSSNSDKLDFKVSRDKDNKNLIKYEIKKSNGRIMVSFNSEPEKYNFIYLTIFQKDDKEVINDRLTNYVFKYINVNDTKYIYDYEVSSMDIQYSRNNENIEHNIKIEAIKCESCNVKYFVHFISRVELVEGETFDNIAVTESKGIVKEFENEKKDTNGKITFEITGIKMDFAYIQIIAHITEGPINEFISYKSIFFEQEKSNENENTDKNKDTKSRSLAIALTVVGVVCGIIIISLVIMVIRFKIKNEDLMDKVKQTSFSEERNDNLLIDEKN